MVHLAVIAAARILGRHSVLDGVHGRDPVRARA
jgi:hypothetical protein